MSLIVSQIQRFSLEDGPGIRTTIFLKGCNFNCLWCHNPEALDSHATLGVNASKCDGCLRCISICPEFALKYLDDGIHINRECCTACGKCVPECYQGVFSLCGVSYEPERLLEEVLEDSPYFKASQGGVTFSGGEPFLQMPDLVAILSLCKQASLSVIVQTNLSLPFFESVKFVDHYMVDLKIMDNQKHRKWTGSSNEQVLSNLKALDALGCSYEVRTPIVPFVNDTENDVLQIVDFVKTLKNIKRYRLIGYHPLGIPKYKQFGVPLEYDAPLGLESIGFYRIKALVKKEMGV